MCSPSAGRHLKELALISIKKLLNATQDPVAAGLTRVTSLLLEGIAIHAVECDTGDRNEFQSSIRRFRKIVEGMSDPSEILVTTGAAIQTLENYNRGIERFIRIRGKEYEEMVGMFSKALLEVSNAGESSTQSLQRIEKDLRSVSQIDNLRELKAKLGESLKALSEESARQKRCSEDLANAMQENLTIAQSPVSTRAAVEMDPITGLAGHSAAERELRVLIAAGESRYVAIFCVERLDLINSRFGFAAGDQILMMFSQYVAQQLSGNDRLFRWRGPCVVAILARQGNFSELQAELRRAASVRLEHNVTIGSRSVLLPISQCWSVLKVSGTSGPEELFARVDSFVAGQATKTETFYGK
jgi:GGDEF domain-containing protein